MAEVLAAIVVLSFFIERALSLLFEHRLFVKQLAQKGLKEPIAFLVSLAVVRYWNFDALSVVFHADTGLTDFLYQVHRRDYCIMLGS